MNSQFSLVGKHALICGASKGIGAASALQIATLGARVCVLARSADRLQKVVEALPSTHGQEHAAIVCDVKNPDDLKEKIDSYVSAKGPIHILVNNTGGPASGAILDANSDEFLAAFHQHLLCNHLLTKCVLAGMKQEKYGRIINIISTSIKCPIKGLGVSNTIRGAVASWSKTLAGEVALFGITVNNILPGATETDRLQEIFEGKAKKLGKSTDDVLREEKNLIPAGRFAKPEEIANAAAFLASPAASYITGINLPVDGGRTPCL